MNTLNRLSIAVFLGAIFPGLALLITFIVSASNNYIEWCIPMVDGCASISKAARNGISLYIFRLLIVPGALFQLLFWLALYSWGIRVNLQSKGTLTRILILGITSVIFLIIYANFLGTEGTLYKFMRRTGIYVYFGTTVTAHFLLSLFLSQAAPKLTVLEGRCKKMMYGISLVLLIFALSQAFFKLFIAEHDAYENIIEWNIAIAMHLPFLVFSNLWQKEGFDFSFKFKDRK